ncbi:LysR substrate-binding domain-containing protein [Salinicola avicenniae]|uniref:LysR substrate-binding domain-containing protein n=1 Tax=Salinicola avicenniae TaxID=2916836 RepID=UPI0020737C7E|nr:MULTISPECIES: LysR substrate-binding domain-containing protein [unclassified Salinicola]
MALNLRQIEVFRAVMTTGSISGASRVLMISQPAVSRMLSHTEQRIGFPLFERVKGRLYPSPEARRLFRDVENVYRDVQRVNTTLHDLTQRRHGVVRIAASSSLGHQLVPWAITSFRAQHDVRVSLDCQRHVQLRDQLLDRQADLGISLFPVNHPNLEVHPLHQARMVCVCPVDHPLADRGTVTLAELRQFDLIGYGAETPFGQHIRSAFESAGEPWRPATEVDSPHYACALADAGGGIALIDEFTWRGWRGDRLTAVPLPDEQRLIVSLAYPRTEPLSQLARAFISHLDAAFARCGESGMELT